MAELDYFLSYLTKWYSVIFLALGLYVVVSYIEYKKFVSKHGCVEAKKREAAWLGLPALVEMLGMKKGGEMVDYIRQQFVDLNVQTFFLRLGGVRVVFTEDPENIKAILATQFNDFALGTRHAHFKPMLGDGIFTLDGEGWKHSRAMLRPQFAREQVAHVKSLEPHIQTFAKHIRNAKGGTVDVQDLFFKLTVDTATEFLFGESVHSLHDSSIDEALPLDFDGKSGFADAFNVSQQYLASRSYSQMFYFLVNNKEFRDTTARVHKFSKYYVNKALNATQDELDEKSKDGYVFLYELVKQTRDPKVLQDQLLNILLAGRDTTAGLLSFTIFELARNPHIFEKLKKEIYGAFGSGDNVDVSEITFESLKKCDYLKYVLNEVLRLYPSVPVNFRVAQKMTTIPRGGGTNEQSPVYVGKGTTVAYSVYSTHRSEEVYGKDALDFIPERWENMTRLGWSYVPFNGGPRICLGQQFALTEASYVITRLIQMFPNLISKDNRPYPPKKAVHLTMCHQDGVFVSWT